MNTAFLLGVLLGLGGAILEPHALRAEPVVANYFPLAVGNRWSYESDGQSSTSRVMESWEVIRQDQNAFALRITLDNDRVSSFETLFVPTSAGVGRLVRTPKSEETEDGALLFVLKIPLTVGAKWDNEDGRYEVTAVQKTITVPAGTFPNCVEVTHHSKGDRVTVVTLYAPEVGVVMREETYPSPEGSGSFSATQRDHVTLQLKEWVVSGREH